LPGIILIPVCLFFETAERGKPLRGSAVRLQVQRQQRAVLLSGSIQAADNTASTFLCIEAGNGSAPNAPSGKRSMPKVPGCTTYCVLRHSVGSNYKKKI